MTKLKHSEVAGLRKRLLEKQENRCAICACSFSEAYYSHKKRKVLPKHVACLDHCHKTGQIRGVLCSGCNSLEGKVINAIERWHTNVCISDTSSVSNLLYALANYYSWHRVDHLDLIHPSFKTEEEKRLLKNKRARLARKNGKQKKGTND